MDIGPYTVPVLSIEVATTVIDSNAKRRIPEKLSGTTHEERFSAPILNDVINSKYVISTSASEISSGSAFGAQFNKSVPGADVNMVDAEVANINALNEFESLKDITVYEVVTEHQATPKVLSTYYPHIFLQLCDGQIINAENSETINNSSQFLNTIELREPFEIETTPTLLSQKSPRLIQIVGDYVMST